MRNTPDLIATSLLCAMLWVSFQARAQADSAKVIVRFMVKSNYEAVDSTISQIHTLNAILPATRIKKGSVRQMVDLIQKTYSVRCSNANIICRVLNDRILALNNVRSFTELLNDDVLIPTLPLLKAPSDKKSGAIIVKYTKELGTEGVLEAPLKETFSATSAEKVFVDVEMTMSEYDSLARTSADYFSPVSVPVSIQFEIAKDSSEINSDWAFIGFDTNQIVSLVESQPTQRVPYIFILDSGFPNKQRYDESIAEFTRIMDKAWLELETDPPKRQFPPFKEPSCRHCKLVESALDPLISRGSLQKNVKLIYIPLSKEQGGDQFLFELIRYHEAKTAISDGELSKKEIKRRVQDADTRATKILKSLPDEIGSKCDSDNVKTNYNIMYGLQYIADFISENEKTYYFINLSWNPTRSNGYLTSTLTHRGLFVVSAGNVPNDIVKARVPFGNFVVDRGDVYAAVNVKGSVFEANCKTGWVASPQDRSYYKGLVLGFPGDLSPSNCGGTSFSSPRLALFFALGESIRKKYRTEFLCPNIEEDVLTTIQLSATNPFQAIWFDPLKYLTTIKNK